jgi:hypothetical protein
MIGSVMLGCTLLAGMTVAGALGQTASQGQLPDGPVVAVLLPEPGSSTSVVLEPQSGAATGSGKASQNPSQPKQTKRILGLIPNFKSVNADQELPPMSIKEEFIEATEDTFDYSALPLPALLSLYNLKTNATPQFGHGGLGYGRYLWHAVLDQTTENYFVEFIVPAATHEDPRYYTLGKGGFRKRALYSLSRVVITRSNSGSREFNASEVLGAGLSAGLSNAYYPSSQRTFGNTAKQWGTDVGVDAVSFLFKEFWPDINQKLTRHKN